MRGYAHFIIFSNPCTSRRFQRVHLTLVGDKNYASLTRNNAEEDPEELLCIESVQSFILSEISLDLEGFARVNPEDDTYYKCVLYFVPDHITVEEGKVGNE